MMTCLPFSCASILKTIINKFTSRSTPLRFFATQINKSKTKCFCCMISFTKQYGYYFERKKKVRTKNGNNTP